MKYYGSCLCGSVSFEINGVIEQVIHCHCDMCKKSHGAAFASFGVVAQDAFQWIGQEAIGIFNSSPDTQRTFCKKCGSPLQWHKSGDSFCEGKISFSLGLLDTPFTPNEELNFFKEQKAKWYLAHE